MGKIKNPKDDPIYSNTARH